MQCHSHLRTEEMLEQQPLPEIKGDARRCIQGPPHRSSDCGPLSISRSGNREDHFHGTVCDDVNYSLSEDRISIPTPENGTLVKILGGKRLDVI